MSFEVTLSEKFTTKCRISILIEGKLYIERTLLKWAFRESWFQGQLKSSKVKIPKKGQILIKNSNQQPRAKREGNGIKVNLPTRA